MHSERLDLWPEAIPLSEGRPATAVPALTVYQPEQPAGAAIVICPGGGYGSLAIEPEGHGIARWLAPHGIAGIVLEYRFPRGDFRVPLLDAQRAIRTVRANASRWRCDPARIGIMGFSAGGHLASTAGTQFDGGIPAASDPIERFSCRPDFMVLIYPVITMGEGTHAGTRANLLGSDPSPEAIGRFSGERQVTARTPPAFLAHARDDVAVPLANSRAFHDSLAAHGVASELLELPSGGHGLNGYKGPMWDAWQAQSLAWMAARGLIPGNRASTSSAGAPPPLR